MYANQHMIIGETCILMNTFPHMIVDCGRLSKCIIVNVWIILLMILVTTVKLNLLECPTYVKRPSASLIFNLINFFYNVPMTLIICLMLLLLEWHICLHDRQLFRTLYIFVGKINPLEFMLKNQYLILSATKENCIKTLEGYILKCNQTDNKSLILGQFLFEKIMPWFVVVGGGGVG